MYQESIQTITPELEKTLEFLKKELGRIRTGQASPALVEDVLVEVFGKPLPLKQLAGISCPERRQILIQPWDASYLEPMEKALQKASLGSSPVVEGKNIRIMLPQLTQEYREQLKRLLSEKGEQARTTLRKWRDEAWSEIQARARAGKMREDDKFKGKDELQKIIDEYGKKIDELISRKKQEIES